jgi:hypothetical protein
VGPDRPFGSYITHKRRYVTQAGQKFELLCSVLFLCPPEKNNQGKGF